MRLLPIIMVLLLATPVHGEPLRYSLKQAIDEGLSNNHHVKGAGKDREAGAEGVAIARSSYFPRLFLEEAAVVTNSPTKAFMLKLDQGRFSFNNDFNNPPTGNDFRTSLSLQQPLFDLSIGRQVDVAAAEEKLRGFYLTRKREEVGFRIFVLYLGVQRARAHLTAVEQAVLAAGEHRRLAAARTAAGTGLKGDELRLRTYLTERELEQLTAANDLHLAQLRLASAIGKSVAPVDAEEEIPTINTTRSREELLQVARQRAELREGSAMVERADSMVRVAESAYFPTVHATASYQQDDRDLPFGRDHDAWTVGATLRWELFDGLRRRHSAAQARAERSAAAEKLEEAGTAVSLEIEESLLRLREAEKRREVVQQALVDAEEVVRLVSKRYENSLATVSDLLDAQTALNRRRSDASDAGIDATLAAGRVNHAAGIFLQEVMK